MSDIYWLVSTLIQLFIWVLLIWVIMSWLVSFNVLNSRNRVVAVVYDVSSRMVQPLLRPIQRIVPSFGGLDISPILLVLGLLFLDRILYRVLLGTPAPL